VLALRVAATDAVLAVCAVVLVALVNVFVVFACRTVIGLIVEDTDIVHEIEPLTGLLTRDALCELIVDTDIVHVS